MGARTQYRRPAGDVFYRWAKPRVGQPPCLRTSGREPLSSALAASKSFLALLLRKELQDRLEAQGDKLEWAAQLHDVAALQYTDVNSQGKRLVLCSDRRLASFRSTPADSSCHTLDVPDQPAILDPWNLQPRVWQFGRRTRSHSPDVGCRLGRQPVPNWSGFGGKNCGGWIRSVRSPCCADRPITIRLREWHVPPRA